MSLMKQDSRMEMMTCKIIQSNLIIIMIGIARGETVKLTGKRQAHLASSEMQISILCWKNTQNRSLEYRLLSEGIKLGSTYLSWEAKTLEVASISLMKKARRLYPRKRLSIPINAVRSANLTLSRVELSTRESGREASVMDTDYNSGLMVLSMKENGERIELTEKVSSCT